MITPADSILLRELTPRGLLSFGPETEPIALQPLNIIIGANGSGKSNLIETIALLRATPDDMRAVVRAGGGAGEWIWKGSPRRLASIDAVVRDRPLAEGELRHSQPLRHHLTFGQDNHGFYLEDEFIELETPSMGLSEPMSLYRFQHGRPVVITKDGERKLDRTTLDRDRSILAQRRDPETYPAVSYLAGVYEQIRIYREWAFGRNTVFREPQRADMRNDRLEEDFSNLGLFLNKLRRSPDAKDAILEGLRDLYEGFSDFDVSIEGGSVQVFFTEGKFTVPATRLSDGTLRYLCLLAILCDPAPPPLICIEEPELGLHPDILPNIADLLISASERTQLIVTTHSDILVDAMTERPEAVLVCEKHSGVTEIRRLDRDALAVWLEKYRLGDLWISGQLGGKRW